MNDMKISDSVKFVGVNDHKIDLFEGQFSVPEGMSYNSYLILDEIRAVSDDILFNEDHIIFLINKYRNLILKQNYLKNNKDMVLCQDLVQNKMRGSAS